MGKNLRLLHQYLRPSDILAEAEGINSAIGVTKDSIYSASKQLKVRTGVFIESMKTYPIDRIKSVEIIKKLFVYRLVLRFSDKKRHNERAIMFYRSNLDNFVSVVEEIERVRAQLLKPSVGGVISISRQIRELAELKDQGVINQREFNRSKKDLLDRLAA